MSIGYFSVALAHLMFGMAGDLGEDPILEAETYGAEVLIEAERIFRPPSPTSSSTDALSRFFPVENPLEKRLRDCEEKLDGFCPASQVWRGVLAESEGDPEAGVDLPVVQGLVEQELQRIEVVPGRVVVQPGGGEVLVNLDAVFYADVSRQEFDTSLLGYSVVIEVEPVWFEWDFGDGSEVVGVGESGGPYPGHAVSHVYSRSGGYEVGLRTVWQARFRVEGVTGWIEVGDQPVTDDVFGPLQAVAKTNRLVK